MLICRVCGKKFDPKNGVGHIDDHVEVCPACKPEFDRKMHIGIALKSIANHVIRQYRLRKNGQRPVWAMAL
jgi:hypothetical protein